MLWGISFGSGLRRSWKGIVFRSYLVNPLKYTEKAGHYKSKLNNLQSLSQKFRDAGIPSFELAVM
jgi:hypothetical protein